MTKAALSLAAIDWGRLHHAYGFASDTPGQLAALLGDDPTAQKDALMHLWSAILHQGTPWLATPPASIWLCEVLLEHQLEPKLRLSLLEFLLGVSQVIVQGREGRTDFEEWAKFDMAAYQQRVAADLPASSDPAERDEALFMALYENEDAANAIYAQSVLGCVNIAPKLLEVMQRDLRHADPAIRAVAGWGAVQLAPLEQRAALEASLLALARAATSSDERCAQILSLNALGDASAEFLNDPALAVRACVALSNSQAKNPVAHRILAQALESPEQLETWFEHRPPQFPMKPRFAFLRCFLERTPDFEQALGVALAVLRVASKSTVDYDWGPLLRAAFPLGDGRIHTRAQRQFLQALVDTSELWDPHFGNAQGWFQKVNLPYDRQQCSALLKESMSN